MIKKTLAAILSIGAALFSQVQSAAENQDFIGNIYNYIENLDVFEYGQEESHAYYIPEHHKLLNGSWKFFYADTPEEIPSEFYAERYSDSKWDTIDVPSNWEI